MKAKFAPDTNFLEQFKQPSDLPWSELTEADEVELVLLTAVLRELDTHNHGPNGRRHRAAERVLKATRGLKIGKPVVLRESNPRVYFSEPDILPNKPDLPAWIDTSKSDEAILAEVLAYRNGGMAELVLLTADRTLERLARRAGVPAFLAPDAWKLPPEPDPQVKKVEELERRMKSLEGRVPTIRVWPEVDDAEVETIAGTVVRFRPLTSAFIQHAMNAVQEDYPPATVPAIGKSLYTKRTMEKYQEDRQAWLTELLDVLTSLHKRLNFQQGMLPLTLCLENSGAATATGFVVEVDAEGAFHFVDGEDDDVEKALEPFGLPRPPVLKPSTNVFIGDPINLHRPLGMPFKDVYTPRPDSPEFHWVYEKVVGSRVKGVCGQFRRGRRPEEFGIDLLVEDDELEAKTEVRGCLVGWFTADNLAEQGEFSFAVRIALDWKNTEEAAAKLLKKHLSVHI